MLAKNFESLYINSKDVIFTGGVKGKQYFINPNPLEKMNDSNDYYSFVNEERINNIFNAIKTEREEELKEKIDNLNKNEYQEIVRKQSEKRKWLLENASEIIDSRFVISSYHKDNTISSSRLGYTTGSKYEEKYIWDIVTGGIICYGKIKVSYGMQRRGGYTITGGDGWVRGTEIKSSKEPGSQTEKTKIIGEDMPNPPSIMEDGDVEKYKEIVNYLAEKKEKEKGELLSVLSDEYKDPTADFQKESECLKQKLENKRSD